MKHYVSLYRPSEGDRKKKYERKQTWLQNDEFWTVVVRRTVGGNQKDERWTSFYTKMSTAERVAELPLCSYSLLRAAT